MILYRIDRQALLSRRGCNERQRGTRRTAYRLGGGTRLGLPGDGINGIMEALRTRQDKIRFIIEARSCLAQSQKKSGN
jgi:hypothetical protein